MDRIMIDKFREKVNKNDLIWHMYHNKNGRNQWSIICSAMDWIDVVVDEIDTQRLIRQNNNEASIKVMMFINCIDILWESIQQLHRVFFNTNKIPFADDESVFEHKLFASKDNEYFKTIRACFSAHPVNLRDNFSNLGEKENRYASWSGGGFSSGDFSVILYSNRVGCDSVFLDIYFDELFSFARKRYYYLQTIMDEIDRQIDKYYLEWRKTKIPKVDNPLEQINILISENKNRFNNDYYSYELKRLQVIFRVKVGCPKNKVIVDSFRKRLLPVVEKFYENIQDMRLEDIDLTDRLDVKMPENCRYSFSKLSEAVYGNPQFFYCNLDSIQTYLGSIVDLSQCETSDEMYTTVLAGFSARNNIEA